MGRWSVFYFFFVPVSASHFLHLYEVVNNEKYGLFDIVNVFNYSTIRVILDTSIFLPN